MSQLEMPGIGSERFPTLVVDPPWPTRTGPMSAGGMGKGFVGGSTKSQPLQYPTMSIEEIAALAVCEIALPDSHLYLWTTNRFIEEAFGVARAWGFEFSTMRVWCKKPMGGGLGGAYGISTEYVLFCRRGSLKAKKKIAGTAFHHKRPYDERGKPKHSAKPPEFLDEVETVSPGPYVELFSREKKPRPGWKYWGDESLGTAELPAEAA